MKHGKLDSRDPDEHLHLLMLEFNFNAEDLAENIQERITQRQKAWIVQTYQMNKWVVIAILGLLPLWIAVYFGFIYQDSESTNGFFAGLAVCIVPLVVFLGMVWLSNQRLIQQDINDVVLMVCGQLTKTIVDSETLSPRHKQVTQTPVIEIQREQFFVTESQYNAVSTKRAYCIYYADASQMLLSIRPIESVGDNPFAH